MPIYEFRRVSTGEIFEEFMSISARDEKLKDPDIEPVMGAPAIVSGVSIRNKTDHGWRDVLKKVKKANIDNNINSM